MKFGSDAMKKQSRIVIEKIRHFGKNKMEGVECTLSSSVTAQIIVVDIPSENIKISIPTRELLTVLDATNAKYHELRQQELGTPLIKDNVSRK